MMNRNSKEVWTPQKADKVISYLDENPHSSLRELAKVAGMSYESVRRHLGEASLHLGRSKSNVNEYATKWGCSNEVIRSLIETGEVKATKTGCFYYILPGQSNPRICKIKGCNKPVGKGRRGYCGQAHMVEGKRLNRNHLSWKKFRERKRCESLSVDALIETAPTPNQRFFPPEIISN